MKSTHTFGRTLEIGPTDNTSDQRTPRNPLRLIPDDLRESFVPCVTSVPGLTAHDADMTRIAPDRPRASGVPIEVSGKLLDQRGNPLRSALIEIWNANTHGRYTHIEDHTGLPLDPNFIGLGRVLTNEEGDYRFWTIRPGCYLARPDINRWRPKHIHLSVVGSSARLITQMYFDGDEHNDSDPMRILMGDSFERNVGKEYDAKSNDIECGYQLDIVVGGRNTTFFEE